MRGVMHIVMSETETSISSLTFSNMDFQKIHFAIHTLRSHISAYISAIHAYNILLESLQHVLRIHTKIIQNGHKKLWLVKLGCLQTRVPN